MPTLEAKLAAGQLVITAELPVIDGGGRAEVERQLAPMRDWLDAVNATDNPSGHAHASPLAVAIALRDAGVEPIMQLVCRDRNRLALQSELVGAAMHGIENVVALTGDDVSAGDEPEASASSTSTAPSSSRSRGCWPTAATCRAARSSPRRTSWSAPSRTPARRPSTTGSSARS